METPTMTRKQGKIRSAAVGSFHFAWVSCGKTWLYVPGSVTSTMAAIVSPRRTSSESSRCGGPPRSAGPTVVIGSVFSIGFSRWIIVCSNPTRSTNATTKGRRERILSTPTPQVGQARAESATHDGAEPNPLPGRSIVLLFRPAIGAGVERREENAKSNCGNHDAGAGTAARSG